MGLLRSGIYMGGAYAIANSLGKNLKESRSQSPSYQAPQQPQQQMNFQRSAPGQYWADNNGYAHQSFCNGSCGQRCNSNIVAGQSATRSLDNGAEGLPNYTPSYNNSKQS